MCPLTGPFGCSHPYELEKVVALDIWNDGWLERSNLVRDLESRGANAYVVYPEGFLGRFLGGLHADGRSPQMQLPYRAPARSFLGTLFSFRMICRSGVCGCVHLRGYRGVTKKKRKKKKKKEARRKREDWPQKNS